MTPAEMTPADLLELLRQTHGPAIVSIHPEALDPFAVVVADRLPEVCRFLQDDPRCRFDMLANLTAVDYLEPDPKKVAKAGFEPHLEVVYHLASVAVPGRRLTLKVRLPRWKNAPTNELVKNAELAKNAPTNELVGELPEVPSVSAIWRTADWHEREAYDLVGIRFIGHPDLRRILTADDWVGHPLRKDYEFPQEYHDIRCR